MDKQQDATLEGWCIIEILGHRKLGGMVREVQIAGAGFLRIDVPNKDGVTVATQFYPPSSVYAITPVAEEVARAFAVNNMPQPVTRWELPAPRSVEPTTFPAMQGYDDEDDGRRPF